jgi:hypothetical protein
MENIAMRAVLPIVMLGCLAACTHQRSAQYSDPAPAYQPPVSYQAQPSAVTYSEAAPAPIVNADSAASAAAYCQRYGMVAQLQSVQPPAAGNTAIYNCAPTTPVAGTVPYYAAAPSTVAPAPVYQAPAPVYGAAPVYNNDAAYESAVSPPVVRCADPFHQDRPGGSDYRGPPVPGC